MRAPTPAIRQSPAGILALDNNLALQNSALDTTTGTGTVSLGAGITTPTLGGLTGSTNLVSKITTGYSNVTSLTLNPNSGSQTYSGIIANGAANMSLTKTGAGTQTLSGANTYTGATTINAGILNVGSLAAGGSASGIGAGANTVGLLNFGGGTLQYNGSSAQTTDHLFTINTGGATLDASGTGSGTMSFTNTGALSVGTGGTARSLTLTGTNTGANTLASTLGTGSSTISLVKSGAGKWVLTGANTYTGGTTISGGTLALSGGNDRLATAGTVNFSAAGTLDVGSTQQTLVNMTVGNTITGTVNGVGGKLTLTGSSFALGGGSGQTNTLNMSGLTTFAYNNAAGGFLVSGATSGSVPGGAGVLTLAGTTNTITALTFGVGNGSGGGNNTSVNQGIVNLGVTNTIESNTIAIGGIRGAGTLRYLTGTNTSLTLRGSDGSSRVTSMIVGDHGSTNLGGVFGTVDLTTNVSGTSTLDAMITTLTIGRNNRNAAAGGGTVNNTGTFTMGGGTLDATTINLAQVLPNFTGSGASSKTTGNLTVTGGTIKVGNFYFADQTSDTTTGATLEANFNFNGGANLYATNIAKGPGTGTMAATRTFNWNDGTIHNYDASTDLTFGTGITVKLAATGTHTFDIGTSRTGNVSSQLSDATTGGTLTKSGLGTLELTAANTYSGITTVSAGTLSAGNISSANNNLGSATSAVVLGNATNQGTLSYTGNTATYTRGFTIGGAGGGRLDVTTSGQTLTVGIMNGVTGSGLFTIGGAGDSNFTAALTHTGGLTKEGAGTATLTNTNTYNGDTRVNAGTLVVSDTGSLQNNGPEKIYVAAPDNVHNPSSDPMISRVLAGGTDFSDYATGFGSTSVSANLNTTGTTAAIRAGIISGLDTVTVNMQWRTPTGDESSPSNPNAVLSDIVSLEGIPSLDVFLLEMKYNAMALGHLDINAIAVSGELRLGWKDGIAWKSAVAGNVGDNGDDAVYNFQGSWADFIDVHGDAPASLGNYLGSYGVDPGTQTVWAVLNHNSEFAVIPEPSTLVVGGLALLGFVGVGLRRRRMRAE